MLPARVAVPADPRLPGLREPAWLFAALSCTIRAAIGPMIAASRSKAARSASLLSVTTPSPVSVRDPVYQGTGFLLHDHLEMFIA